MLFISSTTAATAKNIYKGEPSSNYTMTPSFDPESGLVDNDTGILTVYDTISQGETNIHGKNIGSGLTLLVVDLNWEDSTDSLRLKIYTPKWISARSLL
ncbi:hypothetical protein [Methanosarcina barkeri]|uniref:hypothetical protein n=1 Tax=Methanosarcina barkeri TaxID=2208 RepID=UPI001E38B3D0|nr:hypothetical protein [Methanosarcina barkeri]